MEVREPSAKYLAKPAYKHTEVGTIPSDWEVKSLGEVGIFEKGKGLLKGDIKPYGGTPAIPYTALYTDFSEVVDHKRFQWFVDDHVGTYVTSEACLLVASSSNMAENTGKASALVGNMAVAIGREVIVFKSNLNLIFTSYLMSTSPYRRRTLALARGTTIKHVYPATFHNYKIAVPSQKEQQAIAEAISDTDVLIESLERLLAKKRQIKQGAMQELLSGQRRLPGFAGEWEVKRLGDIAHIKTGGRNNQDKVEDGEYPFFVRSATVERINSYSNDCEAILVPGEGNIGSIFHYVDGRFDVHQRVYAITQFSPEVSGQYVYLYMTVNFGAHAMQNSVKATVDSLRLPTFQEFQILLPPSIQEQFAIATVLSDMDDEIAALGAKLAKARDLKQGMMQELLTGRIRLV